MLIPATGRPMALLVHGTDTTRSIVRKLQNATDKHTGGPVFDLVAVIALEENEFRALERGEVRIVEL
jgi:hypothetical protein